MIILIILLIIVVAALIVAVSVLYGKLKRFDNIRIEPYIYAGKEGEVLIFNGVIYAKDFCIPEKDMSLLYKDKQEEIRAEDFSGIKDESKPFPKFGHFDPEQQKELRQAFSRYL